MAQKAALDRVDRTILTTLQENARTTNAEIARQLGMAPSAILERIRKLESRGLIQGHETRIDPVAVGLPLLAFVQVRVSDRIAEMTTGDRLAEIPNVQEVHHVAGEDCYLVKIRAADPKDLGELLREQIGSVPSVLSTRTTIVLETVKESGRLPLLPLDTAPDTEPSSDR